mgnify:CR=1 FL=1
MAIKYTRRSGGGSFKGRNAPSDKKVTEKEQRIIEYLERQRQQTKEVSTDFIRSTEGVMQKELDNKQTLQTLKTDLWKAKVDNVKKRQKTEVEYYEGLAKQAGDDAEFWRVYTPKLADDLSKFAETATHTVQYLRDRHVDNQNKKREEEERNRTGEYSTDSMGRDYDDPEYGSPERAFNSIIGESNKEQAKLHAEGDFKSADVLAEQVYGKAANTKWWGVYYGRKATESFEEEWPAIVSLASEGVDPSQVGEDLISESFYGWMRHKGVSLNSVAGKEVSKRFRKKLAALSTNKLQQTLVQRDSQKSDTISQDIHAAIKTGKGLEGLVTQMVLHESRAHKMVNGRYSAPESRILNYGQTFDSLSESLLKTYPWSNWEEFDTKILSLPVIADKNNYDLPVDHPRYKKRPIWRDQRANMIDTYKDIFAQTQKKEIARIRGIEQGNIRGRIAELTARTTDSSRDDYIDSKTEEGRKQLYALLKSAESQEEKKFIGDQLVYDPKSQVETIVHEQMLRALDAQDATEFLWHFNNLKDFQKKYYQDRAEFASRQELIKANWKYKDTEDHVEAKVKSLLSENWNQNTNFESFKEAKKWGIQRFYDINETIDTERFPNGLARIAEVKRLLNDDFKDPNGLFKVEAVGNRDEFIHFLGSTEYKEPGWFRDKAEGLIERFGIDLKPTLDEIKNLDLIPEKDAINIMKDIATGTDGIRLPKILWDVHKKTGLPLVDIVNTQLTREGIAKNYNYEATEKDLLKATQVEYLEQKAPKEIADTTSPQNVAPVSGWYDVRDWLKYNTEDLNLLEQILLPFNLQKYNKNMGLGNQSSLMDDIEVPYEIIEGRTRFSDPELAIRRGQEEGLVYNPWTDTMMEVA